MQEFQFLDEVEYSIIREEKNRKFGTIQFCKERYTNKELIIKEITHPSQIEFLKHGGNKALIDINHPNLPTTCKIKWMEYNRVKIVRELAEGIDLKTILANNKLYRQLSKQDIIHIIIQTLEAVEHLHLHNIIHQDIKPSNVIVNLANRQNGYPHVTLIDLEQSKLLNKELTEQNTPFALIYSAPEQILKFTHLIDARTDIYTTGILLFEVLTRKRPFENLNPEFTINLQLSSPIKNDYGIDNDLFEIVKKATYKTIFPKPPNRLKFKEIEVILMDGIKHRYQSAKEFKSALLEKQSPQTARKWWQIFG